MRNQSWLSNTISQPFPIIADINYCINDYRGKNYFSLFIKKIILVIKYVILWIKDIIIKPQSVKGNFSILSPPYKSINIFPLLPQIFIYSLSTSKERGGLET